MRQYQPNGELTSDMRPGDPGAPPPGWWLFEALESPEIISNEWRKVEALNFAQALNDPVGARAFAEPWLGSKLEMIEPRTNPHRIVMYFANGNALMYDQYGDLYVFRLEDCDPDELAEMYDFYDEMNRSRPPLNDTGPPRTTGR